MVLKFTLFFIVWILFSDDFRSTADVTYYVKRSSSGLTVSLGARTPHHNRNHFIRQHILLVMSFRKIVRYPLRLRGMMIQKVLFRPLVKL